ncbi:telomerase reverse transcriptase [[Candida] railenensis]|uniref:Telomerase reverse transcriptase n=1 Tax=[Candida] railenensis TaxID=45579 RepID=A0A9P0VWJ2_9ASCO|nr:telomerase reverse transcriptase [[Candida] railenensis]
MIPSTSMKYVNTSKDETLRQYLTRQNVDIDSLLSIESDFYSDTKLFTRFLDSTLITPISEYNTNSETLDKIKGSLDQNLPYSHVINTLIRHLLDEKIYNVLAFGYSYRSDKYYVNSEVHNPNVSFNVNQLKSHLWETLYRKIPIHKYLRLVLTTNCFIRLETGNYAQIFGSIGANLNRETLGNDKIFMKSKVLYREESYYKFILPNCVDNLMLKLTKSRTSLKRKKFRNLKLVCQEILENHAKCPYSEIFKSLVSDPFPVGEGNFFELSTPLALIIRFVSVILGKVFPLKLWGSTRNRSLIFHKVVEYIRLGKNEYLQIHAILSGIKTTDILWINNVSSGKVKSNSLQHNEKSKTHLIQLLSWFFNEYIPNLVGCFWYVTESSKGVTSELLYYPQKIWRKMSVPWFENYKRNYLRKSYNCFVHDPNNNQRHTGKEYFHGKPRLIPKQHDFRLLCIPVKSDIRKYNSYLYNYIYPLRALLRKKVHEKSSEYKHPCCYSTSDVIMNLQGFIKRLNLNNEGKKLYVVKFDMKQCYDMLNKRQIINTIDKLFEFQGSRGEYKYFIREFGKARSTTSKFRNTFYEIKDKLNINKFDIYETKEKLTVDNASEPVLVDRCITKVFSGSEIYNIIYDQVFHSTLVLKNDNNSEEYCFERQRGLFQGFPLSGTLCDITYNDLVQTYFNFLKKESSILLRLADDFLVISTDRDQCEQVNILIQEGFDASHGAFVNTEKTVTINLDINSQSIVQFVGLQFNPSTLEIIRSNISKIPISQVHLRNSKSLFSYLTLYYQRNLNEFNFDFETESACCILDNIESVLQAVLDSFCTNIKAVSKTDGNFEQDQSLLFLLNLLVVTLDNDLELTSLEVDIANIFEFCLKSKLKNFPFLQGVIDLAISFIKTEKL